MLRPTILTPFHFLSFLLLVLHHPLKLMYHKWLTYWVTYAFLTVFESAVSAVYWFPFYYTFKFMLVLWMALPQTGGAQFVFRSFIQPVFAKYFERTASGTSANLRSQVDSATSAKTL